MAENLSPAACSESEYEVARTAGLLIVTTAEEQALHRFAVAMRSELLEALERANRILAELAHSSAIPGDDFTARDTRQRVKAAHESCYAAIAKAIGAA